VVEIEFNAAKDRRNRAKHSLSLGFAAELDWDSMYVATDDSEDYGEERWIGVAPKGKRLYTVIFTVLDDETMRIISLRHATNAEIRRYESQSRK
jgi:uncharacterized protein